MKRLLLVFLIAVSTGSFGQDNFRKEIDRIYNFHPHLLSEAEQAEKFPVLDSLFEKVKSDTTQYLPLLRQELKSKDHFPYFYYDGAHLLLMLSKSQADQELCAEALAKSNLRDLDPQVYVSLLSYLAGNHINTTQAAVKILEDSTFHFYLIEHGGFDFIQGYCLLYCLLPIDPNLYLDSLTKIFQRTRESTVQKSIITLFWFAYSCSGDTFLLSLNESNTLSKEVSDYTKRLLANKKMPDEAMAMFNNSSEADLLEIRKSALTRFSDEAIDDLDFTTKALRKKFNCRQH